MVTWWGVARTQMHPEGRVCRFSDGLGMGEEEQKGPQGDSEVRDLERFWKLSGLRSQSLLPHAVSFCSSQVPLYIQPTSGATA